MRKHWGLRYCPPGEGIRGTGIQGYWKISLKKSSIACQERLSALAL